MVISKQEMSLIKSMSNNIFDDCSSVCKLINKNDIEEVLDNIKKVNSDEYLINNSQRIYTICADLRTLHYQYSVMLSEVRQQKRIVTNALFELNPKLAQEKSVLKEKLDSNLEYAELHKKEEFLFQFINHIDIVVNNIIFNLKLDKEES